MRCQIYGISRQIYDIIRFNVNCRGGCEAFLVIGIVMGCLSIDPASLTPCPHLPTYARAHQFFDVLLYTISPCMTFVVYNYRPSIVTNKTDYLHNYIYYGPLRNKRACPPKKQDYNTFFVKRNVQCCGIEKQSNHLIINISLRRSHFHVRDEI